ncbi:zinc finger MYM-type protein 6-like [Myzus persicae]|uniref:zinc finger MYM-type protein 6-like n=1 Tax=Myzus persicae TaxID=13164 RepID=UPI000B934D4A|nr:zinc finger MYM-type protein 6-like [Myzus persicae]
MVPSIGLIIAIFMTDEKRPFTICEMYQTMYFDEHFQAFNLHKLVSVTTDGARNMTGKNIGLQAIIINEMKLKELSPPLFFHCIIHQHALCAKIMSWDSIMKEVVSIINFIQNNGLNHGQFQSFFIEINTEYGDVLYYTAVDEKGKDASMLGNQTWISELAFCVDILKYINEINIKLQDKNQLIPDMWFNIDVEDIPVELQMEIVDLQPQDILKDSFKASPLLFFAELPASFSKIKNIAAKYFSMFGSTYVYEQAFSHMKKIKNPYRSPFFNMIISTMYLEPAQVSKEESIWDMENKLYHDKNAKHVSWTKVARASIKDFDGRA